MTGIHIAPRAVWIAWIGTAVLALLAGWKSPERLAYHAGYFSLISVISYALAAVICSQLAGQFSRGSRLRLAWLLIAASSSLAVIRHLMESPLAASLSPWIEYRQVPIALSQLLLLGGLVAIWSEYSSLNLGLSPRTTDIALLLLILILVPPVIWFRGNMGDAQSPVPLIRYAQFASPVLWAAPAAVSILLYRISRQAGDGVAARALRGLMAYSILRLMLLMLWTTFVREGAWGAMLTHAVLFLSSPWLLLLSVVYQANLAAVGLRVLQQHEAARSDLLPEPVGEVGTGSGPNWF